MKIWTCNEDICRKIVIFDEAVYEAAAPVINLDYSDFASYTYRSALEGTYTGAKISYSDPATGEDHIVTVGGGSRIKEINEEADSATDAQKKAVAALNNANKKDTTMSGSIKAKKEMIASRCIRISGFGVPDGVYYLDKVVTKVSGSGASQQSFEAHKTGYRMDNAKVLIDEQQEEVEETEGGEYTVEKGDTLWKIAQKTLGEPLRYAEIYDINKAVIEETARSRGKKIQATGIGFSKGRHYRSRQRKGAQEMANSEIRIGKVSSVNYETGMARVTYRDKDESVTMELPMMNFHDEYRMPEPEQDVVVAHLSNGSSRAVLLGTVWNKKNIPRETGEQLYRKDFSRKKDAAYERYDDGSGEYTLKAANVHLNGINETVLDGPQVEIAANISILLQTEDMQVDTQHLTITGGEEDKLSADIKTDVKIDQEGNEFEALILKALIEFVEDLKIKAGMGIEVTAEEGVKISAGKEINLSAGDTLRFSDGKHSITLEEIVERLGS